MISLRSFGVTVTPAALKAQVIRGFTTNMVVAKVVVKHLGIVEIQFAI